MPVSTINDVIKRPIEYCIPDSQYVEIIEEVNSAASNLNPIAKCGACE